MAVEQVLIDSSFLYTLLDKRQPQHQAAKLVIASKTAQLVVPYVTLTEVAFLFNRNGGVPSVLRFLDAVVELPCEFEAVSKADLKRAREIMAAYPTARLDFVDCCLVAIAERLNIAQVCTFDRRDFSVIRPKHRDYIEILP